MCEKLTNVAFTKFFNDEEREVVIEKFKTFIKEKCKYGIMGLETCPKTGRKHLQGFMSLCKSQRPSYLKKFDKNFHFEKMYKKSSALHNKEYCSKENVIIEYGNINAVFQGARSDLKQKLENYESAKELCLDDPDTYCRYRTGILDYYKYKDETLLNNYKPVEVTYIWGETAVGKTKGIFEKHGPENVCKINCCARENIVFDNYKGQEVLLFDEFRGNLPLSCMLDYLDNYYTIQPCRYADTVAKYKYVYITNNEPQN